MKLIGYIRVSTEEQANEGVSLDNQRHKIEAYCDIYNHELVEIIEDAGQSAKNTNREGFQRLLSLTSSRRPGIDGLIIYKLDRMFRNAEEALRHSSLWDKRNIALISVQEQLDTKSAMGRFFFTLLAAVGEMERNVISERTADALAHKKKNGHKLGGDMPFGFDLENSNGIKKLKPNPTEQDAIRLARMLRKQGMTYQIIANEFEIRHITTKHGKSIGVPRKS